MIDVLRRVRKFKEYRHTQRHQPKKGGGYRRHPKHKGQERDRRTDRALFLFRFYNKT